MVEYTPNMDILAIVPARAGSKRLPGKNTLELHGKPLICWTLEAAQKSRVIDLLVVSSDDDEVLAHGERLGARTLRRPSDLAQDTSTTYDVLLHTLESLELEGLRPARIMLLQPTSPLRDAADIRAAVSRMNETQAKSVVSVCPCEHSPLWSNTLGAQGQMDDFLSPALLNQRSQDLPLYYRLNGAVYIANTQSFIEQKGFFMSNSMAYVMPAEKSVDIDTIIDFKLCQIILEMRV
jgi:CMP-N,N'-diacetyllegionaminic acid synthase